MINYSKNETTTCWGTLSEGDIHKTPFRASFHLNNHRDGRICVSKMFAKSSHSLSGSRFRSHHLRCFRIGLILSVRSMNSRSFSSMSWGILDVSDVRVLERSTPHGSSLM
jgi:hypothetical protein